MLKTCTYCKKDKPLTDFHKDKSYKSGLKQYCKSCANTTSANYRSRNREKYMIHRARARATKQGVPFTVSAKDVFIPKVCPILGIELDYVDTPGGGDASPSLDKIKPELGYVPGNVWVISSKANRMKSSATVEELCNFANWVMTNL